MERLQALQKAAKDNGKVLRTLTLNHKKVYGPIQLTVDAKSEIFKIYNHLKTKNKDNLVIMLPHSTKGNSIQDQIYTALILNPEVGYVSEARYTLKGGFQHKKIARVLTQILGNATGYCHARVHRRRR